MSKFLQRYKPGVSRKSHLFLAALLWTIVGILLMRRGVLWLMVDGNVVYAVPAVLIGTLKSLFILDKSAKKSIDRILDLADGSCLGAVYSVKTWLLVIGMMAMGVLLRKSSIPFEIVGFLYVMVGWALFFSSRTGWKFWKNSRG